MQFYSTFIYILRQLPPGKWVPLGQTVEGESKNSDSFTGVLWNVLRVLLINADINSDSALSEFLVSLRERWGTFISTHHSLEFTAAAVRHYSK